MSRICFAGNLNTNEVRKAVVEPGDDEEVVIDRVLQSIGYDNCVWAIFPDNVPEARNDKDFREYMAEKRNQAADTERCWHGTRWFIGVNSAEGEAYFPVELSKQEFDAVKKFIAAQKNATGEPFSGHFDLLNDGMSFPSKEKAMDFVNEVYLD